MAKSFSEHDAVADRVFESLVQAESAGRHRQADGRLTESEDGALGITQVMPATARDPGFNVDPLRDDSEEEYRRFGREYLRAMAARYDGNEEAMLVAYNAGPGRGDAFAAAGNDFSVLPSEARREAEPYVQKVLGNTAAAPAPRTGTDAPKTKSSAISNKDFFGNLIKGPDKTDDGGGIGTATGLNIMANAEDFLDKDLNAAPLKENLPTELNDVAAPQNLTETFGVGLRSGAAGLRTGGARANAALQTLLGNEGAAERALNFAEHMEFYSSRETQTINQFADLLSKPTFEDFLTQSAFTIGQVGPSAVLSIASMFGGGGVGVLGRVAGRGVLRSAGIVSTKRLTRDLVAKKMKGEALDESEELIVRNAYSWTRAAAQGAKVGGLSGAFGAEFPLIAGEAVNEFVETDGELSRDDAIASFLIGAPLATVGVAGEAFIARAFINAAKKKAAGKTNSIWLEYAKAVAKGTGQSALVEGATEGLQEGGLVALRSSIDNSYTAEQAQLRVAQGIFAGFLAGGAIGGTGSAVASPIGLLRRRFSNLDENGEPLDGGETRRSFMASVQRAGTRGLGALIVGAQKAADYVDAKFFASQEALIDKAEMALGDKNLSAPTLQSDKDLNAEALDMMNPNSPRQSVWLAEMYSEDFGIENPGEIVKLPEEYTEGETLYGLWLGGQGVIISPRFDVVEKVFNAQGNEAALADALGFYSTKPDDADTAVVVRDKDGDVVAEELTNQANVQKVMDHHRQRGEGFTVEQMSIDDALMHRRARVDIEVGDMEAEINSMEADLSNRFGEPNRDAWEPVFEYAVTDFEPKQAEKDTRDQLLQDLSEALSPSEMEPIADAAPDLSTSAIKRLHDIAFKDAGGDVRFIPRLAMEGGKAKVFREPVSPEAAAAELATLRKELSRAGRIPDQRFENSLVRFVHNTKDGRRDVAPNFTRMVNIGVRMNWLDGTGVVSDSGLDFIQQRKAGMMRVMSELHMVGTPLLVKTAKDTFVPFTFDKRQLRDVPGLAGQSIWKGYRDGKQQDIKLGQLINTELPGAGTETHLDFPTNDSKFDVQDPTPERYEGKLRVGHNQRPVRTQGRDFSRNPKDEADSEAVRRVRKEEGGAGTASRQDLVTDDQRKRAADRLHTEKAGTVKNTDPDQRAYDKDRTETVPSRTIREERERFVIEQRALRGTKSGHKGKAPPRYRKPELVGFPDGLHKPIKQVLYVMRRYLVNPEQRFRIMTQSAVRKNRNQFVRENFEPHRQGAVMQYIDNMKARNVVGSRVVDKNGVETIILNMDAVKDFSQLGGEAMMAMVLAHEVGHIIYHQEIDRLRANPELMRSLWKEYLKDLETKHESIKQWTEDMNGFEEWFADKVASYGYREAADARTSQLPEFGGGKVNTIFARVAKVLKAFFKDINRTLKGRTSANVKFDQYMDGVKASIDARREAGIQMPLHEKFAISEMIAGMDTQQNRSRASRLTTLVRNILKGRSVSWIKRHLYASDDYLRSLGESGTALAKLFYGRSQSLEDAGFHERKSQAQNKWINKLAEALQIPVNFDEKLLEKGKLPEAFDLAADETIDTANLPKKARRIREFFEAMFDEYITRQPHEGSGKWVDVKRRENYAPRTLDITKIRDDKDGFINFLRQFMTQPDAEGVWDSIFNSTDPEHDPVGYPAFGYGKGRKLHKVPTKEFIKSGYLLPSSVSVLNYIHQMTKRVEYNKLSLGPKIKQLIPQIVEENSDKWSTDEEKEAFRIQVEKVVMGQFGRLSTFRGKEMADAPTMRAINSIGSSHTVITTLLFAVFASLPDLGGIATRNKEWGSLDNVIRNMFSQTSREEGAALAAAVGVATHESLSNMYMSAQELDHTYQTSQKFARHFFKWSGTEWYTATMRRIATGVGKDYLIYNATHKDFATDPRRARYLKELGVSRKDVLAWHKDRKADGSLKLKGAKFDKVAPAIARFANEAIIRPNPSQRPSWANNPWFTLLWHLKSYFYAYGKTIVSGLGREIKNRYTEAGLFSGAASITILAAGLMLPLAALGLAAREWTKWMGKWILPGMEADGFTFQSRYMTTDEYLVEITDRSGILGPFTLLRSTWEGLEREGIPAGIAISNIPALDAVDDSVFDGDYGRLLPVINNL